MDGVQVESTVTGRVAAAWARSRPSARVAWLVALGLSTLVVRPFSPPRAVGVATAVSGSLLATGAFVDLAERRIPNLLTGAALLVALVGASLSGLALLGRSLLGLVLAAVPMAVVHARRGVGLGDVKMAAAVGASCGASAVVAAPVAVAAAALVAAAFGAITRRAALPLGPFLWLGWASAIAWAWT